MTPLARLSTPAQGRLFAACASSALLLLSSSSARAANPNPSLARVEAAASGGGPLADEQPETLGGPRGVVRHNGWYVGPTLGSTTINGNWALDLGINAGWIANRTLSLGLTGHAFGWDGGAQDNPTLDHSRRLTGAYTGALFRYLFRPRQVVHGVMDLTLGGGFVCTRVKTDNHDACDGGRGFFMVTPAAGVEVNVVDFMRTSITGGYRFAAASEKDGISASDLGGFVGLLNVNFGRF
jgi:hypothetical protein